MLEKTVLAGFGIKGRDDRQAILESLDELESLAKTAGGVTVNKFVQLLSARDPRYVFGKGKIREIADYCAQNNVGTIIFDFELPPSIQKNIAEETSCKILDRTSLILDIFGRRARSREGKMQVELATLKYLAPRLKGIGASMMQQTGGLGAKGGMGTKGPGEKKLELDSRKIRDRITEIQSKIEKLKQVRKLYSLKRESVPVPNVGLVGYTNAGKSTLLKALTGKDTYIDDMLFTTLDPLTKAVTLPSGFRVLFTDTVGFIRNLPHQLIEAFKSTLEEIVKSDLILEVVDVSKPGFRDDMKVVDDVLKEIGADKIDRVFVYNKIDRLKKEQSDSFDCNRNACYSPPEERNKFCSVENQRSRITSNAITGCDKRQASPFDSVFISAVKKEGLDGLLTIVENKLKNVLNLYRIRINYKDYKIINFVRKNGFLKSEKYKPDFIDIEFYIDKKYYDKIMEYAE